MTDLTMQPNDAAPPGDDPAGSGPPHPRLSRRSVLAGVGGAAGALLIPVGPGWHASAAQFSHRPVTGQTRSTDSELLARWIECLHDVVRVEGLSVVAAARVFGYGSLALAESLTGRPAPVTDRIGHYPTSDGDTSPASPAVGMAAMEHLLPTLLPKPTAAGRRAVDAHVARLGGSGADGAARRRGREIGTRIGRWAETDGYAHTLGKKPPVFEDHEGWLTTPPGYAPPADPYCADVRPFVLADPFDVSCPEPLEFSTDRDSEFYAQAVATMTAIRSLTAGQREAVHRFADIPTQSATPVGHWSVLAATAFRDWSVSLPRAMHVYSSLAVGMLDVTLSCFAWKYAYRVQRPVTFIRKHLDPSWTPILSTPPFPEHPSGHSCISSCSAAILTEMLPVPDGRRVRDTMRDPARNWTQRHFPDWNAVATLAGQTRVWGGLHFEQGLVGGSAVGTGVARALLD